MEVRESSKLPVRSLDDTEDEAGKPSKVLKGQI